MAVWAWCLVCDKLVAVKPRGYKSDGSRERYWHPLPHDDREGKPCEGVKRGI